MTVGYPATQVGVNQQIGNLALSLRNSCRACLNFQEWAVTQGSAGLQALGFSSADATSILNMSNYLNTVSLIFFGGATQGTAFNFDNAVSGLYGGM